MKALGAIIKVIGYTQGMFVMFFFGLIPLLAGDWHWNEVGLFLVLGVVSCIILVNIGGWLEGRKSKEVSQ